MIKIKFDYPPKNITIDCKKNEPFYKIFKKFSKELDANVSDFYFMYGGEKFMEKSSFTFEQKANKDDKNRKMMNFVVHKKDEISSQSSSFSFSNKEKEENQTITVPNDSIRIKTNIYNPKIKIGLKSDKNYSSMLKKQLLFEQLYKKNE